jgi:hydroxymethylpyrimidine/phosphomethylpyrimidine kinase
MIVEALVEKHASKQSPSRIEELSKIFIHATKVSLGGNGYGQG